MIANGEVELWLCDLEAASGALESIEFKTPRLSGACERRFASVAVEAGRRERRLAHVALRILLERSLGPSIRSRPFDRSAAGKPSLDGTAASFSLSHTSGLALIAIGCAAPLGVDIERMRSVRMAQSRRLPIEAAAVALAAGAPLSGETDDTRFLRAWVRLEAVAKAKGSGIAPLLEQLRPGPSGSVDGLDRLTAAAAGIVAHDISAASGLFAAIALAASLSPPKMRTMPTAETAIEALLEV